MILGEDIHVGVLFAVEVAAVRRFYQVMLRCRDLDQAATTASSRVIVLLLEALLRHVSSRHLRVLFSARLRGRQLRHVVQLMYLLRHGGIVLWRLRFLLLPTVHGLLEHERKVAVVLVVGADLLL